MEQRTARVMFGTNGKGHTSTSMAMSLIWLKKMGVTPDEREMLLTFDGKRITVEKAPQKKE